MDTFFSGCKYFFRHTLSVVGVLAIAGVLTALVVIYAGAFNVAATVGDSAPLRWLFVTVREAAITSRAKGIQVPAMTGAQQLDRGFRLYRAECAMCHTAPGRTPTPMAVGFNPQAPGFGDAADVMSPAEVFWATKNGIKFTAMPGWGPSKSDAEIWDVVAFVQSLPKTTAADYDALDRRLPPEQVAKK